MPSDKKHFDRRQAWKWKAHSQTLLTMLADTDHPALAHLPIKPTPYKVDKIFWELADKPGVKTVEPKVIYCQSGSHNRDFKIDEVYMFNCGHAFCKPVANAYAVKGACKICNKRPEFVFKMYRDPAPNLMAVLAEDESESLSDYDV
jgi:hypothetical protein